MRRVLWPWLGMCVMTQALAAEPTFGVDVRINLEDQRELHLAAAVPGNTRHQMQVDADLYLELFVEPYPANHVVWGTLVDRAGGGNRTITRVAQGSQPGETAKFMLSVCGNRAISLRREVPGPGRCADLARLTPPDPIVQDCGDCAGPYEDMPATFASRARIAPADEPGEPLTITGRVLGPDGKPRAGIIVYAYQTDRFGIYPPPAVPRSDASDHHGTLRGWARSDARGRYTFDTIRPASYPDTTEPQHVHMHVIEPGCATYFIDEMLFTDDPHYQTFAADPEMLARISRGYGGLGIVTPRRKGKGWEATRDIHLGQKIGNYPGCAAPVSAW